MTRPLRPAERTVGEPRPRGTDAWDRRRVETWPPKPWLGQTTRPSWSSLGWPPLRQRRSLPRKDAYYTLDVAPRGHLDAPCGRQGPWAKWPNSEWAHCAPGRGVEEHLEPAKGARWDAPPDE